MYEIVNEGNGYSLYHDKQFISFYATLEEAVKMIEKIKKEQEE